MKLSRKVALGSFFLLSLPLSLAYGVDIEGVQLQGQWQQGAVIRGRAEAGIQLKFLGRDLKMSPRGDFVLGLGRDHGTSAELIKIDAQGEQRAHSTCIHIRGGHASSARRLAAAVAWPSREPRIAAARGRACTAHPRASIPKIWPHSRLSLSPVCSFSLTRACACRS